MLKRHPDNTNYYSHFGPNQNSNTVIKKREVFSSDIHGKNPIATTGSSGFENANFYNPHPNNRSIFNPKIESTTPGLSSEKNPR
jgi:hypothetical protein